MCLLWRQPDKHIVAKVQALEYRSVYDKARRYAYPQLRVSPFFGPNIKKLKG